MADSSRDRPSAIDIDVTTVYLDAQSSPDEEHFVFAYTVTLVNRGLVPARLLHRHWIITDANGRVEEVRGQGVVGKQPHLRPGEGFRYTSGAVLPTPVGTMRGSYQMITDDGQTFEAEIPPFTLAIPRRNLH
ncbi:MAG: Co2+/Mg2+ efflux protein ApaG [Candidatus Competibacterales bacterium]